MAKYIVGVDAGTSKVKSIVFDAAGEELCVSSRKVELLTPAPGLVEQDMKAVWQSVKETIRDVLEHSHICPDDVAAIAITAQADGLWLVGPDGEPVQNAISWTDGRAMDICLRWYMDGTDRKIYDSVGSTFYPGSYICLIRWLLDHQPEVLEKAEWFGTCKDWIKFCMTGEMSGDDSFAVLADISARKNNPDMVGVYGFEPVLHKIPEMREAQKNHAPLTAQAAAELGLPAGIPVFGGPIDVVSCPIGAGVVNEGDSCVILGTTTMVDFAQDTPDSEPPVVGFTLMSSFPQKWVRAFGVMAGTPNIEWAIGSIGRKYMDAAQAKGTNVYDEIEACISQIPLGSGGVMYHPFITQAGERAPFVKPTAKAQFFGISMEHTTDHLMRAVYEGIGFSVMDCIHTAKTKPTSLRLIGGGSKSPFICQMLADMSGLEVLIPEGHEFGAKGSAIVAAVSLGLFPNVQDAVDQCVRITKKFTPNPENTAKYQKLYELYVAVYKSVWDVWDLRAGTLQGL